eukprot:Skav234122  [mRNA]  locus=scaffold753:24145:26530:- [translate_table: standard]
MAHTHRSLSRAMMDVLADDEEEAPAQGASGAPEAAEEKPSPEDEARPEAELSDAAVKEVIPEAAISEEASEPDPEKGQKRRRGCSSRLDRFEACLDRSLQAQTAISTKHCSSTLLSA